MEVLFIRIFCTRESDGIIRFFSHHCIISDSYIETKQVLIVTRYGDLRSLSSLPGPVDRYILSGDSLRWNNRFFRYMISLLSRIIYCIDRDPSMLSRRITRISLCVVRIFRTTRRSYHFFQGLPRVLYMSLRILSLGGTS